MTHTSAPTPTRVLRTLAACVGLFITLFSYAADLPKQNFDLPAGDAESTLKLFTQQSGEQILYPPTRVAGITTKAVKGEMTSAEALDLMLANTELIAVRDSKTRAFTIQKALSVEEAEKNVARAIANDDRPEGRVYDSAEKRVVLDKYEVTGSRIRGVLGAATVQPVFTYTRQDLDRFGVQTFQELRRYIPQLPPERYDQQLETTAPNDLVAGRVNFGTGLRNVGNNSTLVLINGRRITKLGQQFVGEENYSLNGIPMSAIERIEVLTDGASAVYGADAIAGVINIILKKQYQGAEVTAVYGNTFKTDTADRQVQFFGGVSRNGFSVNVSGSYSKTNSLAPRDRWWTATSDSRAWGGLDRRSSTPGGAGVVRTIDGSNLPGLDSPVAAIPAGSDGVNLTIADFANAGPIPEPWDSAQYADYGHTENFNLRVGAEYELSSSVRVFAEVARNERRQVAATLPPVFTTFISTNPASGTIFLPAGYIGNPFGVPITVQRVFWEMDHLESETEVRTNDTAILAGFRGDLPREWRYEIAAQKTWTSYSFGRLGNTFGGVGRFSPVLLNQYITGPAATQPILLNDGRVSSPNPDSLLASFIDSLTGPTGESPVLWTYDLRADGPVLELPAGAVHAAVGVEMQEDYIDFLPIIGSVNTSNRIFSSHKRTGFGIFAETTIPVISPDMGVPLVHRLGAGLSARRDEYSDFAANVSPRYSLFYHPFKWIGLRGSYGTGFKVPLLTQLHRPQLTRLTAIGSASVPVIDYERNNEAYMGTSSIPTAAANNLSGGNPDLRPEQSESVNLGVLIEVPGVKGLSLSVDYYDLRNTDRVAVPSFQQIIDFFPERYTRGEPTADDIAAGIPGRIVTFNQTSVNLSFLHVSGFDFELKYHREFGGVGAADIRFVATKPTRSVQQSAPSQVPFSDIAASPKKATLAVFWARGFWNAGIIGSYTGDYRRSVRVGFAGDPVKAVTLWDFSMALDLGETPVLRDRAWRSWLANTRLNVNLINVFNKEPQISGPENLLPGFHGLSMGSVDPRGRRFVLSLTKKF